MAKRATRIPKQWERDKEKEKFWRQEIAEWQVSGLSVTEFCRRRNIPDGSFRSWRREISIRDRETGVSKGSTSVTPSLPDKVKDARGRVIPARFKEMCAEAQAKKEMPFVPLTLVENHPKERPAPAVPVAPVYIEVQSPKGFTYKLNCDADVQFLSNFLKRIEDTKC